MFDMSNRGKVVQDLAIFLLFLCIATLSSYFLIPWGLTLLDADTANFLLVTDDILRGHFSAFVYQQPVGGSIFTIMRAFWLYITSHVWKWGTQLDANFYFSYCIAPALIAWFGYVVTRAYSSRKTGLIIGLFLSFGL